MKPEELLADERFKILWNRINNDPYLMIGVTEILVTGAKYSKVAPTWQQMRLLLMTLSQMYALMLTMCEEQNRSDRQ